MTRKKSPESPSLEERQFSLKDIERGKTKLSRRLEEVKKLDRHDDPAVKVAESNISNTIMEVFGPNSPEFYEHQYHTIYYGSMWVNMSDDDYQQNFAAGIPRTIAMLEGLIGRLEEKRLDLSTEFSSAPPFGTTTAAIKLVELI